MILRIRAFSQYSLKETKTEKRDLEIITIPYMSILSI